MLLLRLLAVSVLCIICRGQEGTYQVLSAKKKKKGTFLRAKCTYTLSKEAPAVEFEIGFDGVTKSFKSKKASVSDKMGNVYYLRSSGTVKKKYVVAFSVMYPGDKRPDGACYPLRILEVTTIQTTFGTYSPLTNTFPATIIRSWPDDEGTRIEGLCVFEVNKKIKPKKKHFVIDFGMKVRKYEDWEGYRIEPDGDTGVWFHMKNIHWLHKPSMKFFFQATYDGDESPDILCSSDLKAYITTTQAPVTTTKSPVTTTQAPVTTTKAPVTTTQAPATTTQAPGTTLGPIQTLPYTFPATIKTVWNVTEGEMEGSRMEAVCVFAVDKSYEPDTNYFLIDFGVQVQTFLNWAGKVLQPKSNSGTSFYMTNLNWIHATKLEVEFQATFAVNDSPTVTCSSTLPQLITTTQTPVTSTRSPVTTTQSPVTTTQSPVTTTKAPVTTTKTPVTTDETPETSKTPQTTTNAPTTTTESPATATTTSRQTTQPPVGSFNYNEVIKKSIWFYRAQRSGDLPEVDDDPVPWRGDSALYDGNDVGVDLTGGWYDAGDWVKFNLPISSAAAILGWGLVQWKDAYVTAGQYTDMLDCIKWPLDFFLKCWREDEQVLYGQVGNGGIDHSKMMRPEDMRPANMDRPAYKVTNTGSDLAGSMVAAFAAGSIAFKEADAGYSAQLLAAAESLYIFADTNRGLYTSQIGDAGAYYSSNGYNDELVYAAAMLYKATGNADYLQDAENKYAQFSMDYTTSWAFDWDDKLMAAKVLLYEATGDSRYSRNIQTFLTAWRPGNSVHYTNGGLAWRLKWGSLRYTANTAFIALMAADLGIDTDDNVAWAKGQIDYMLGDNPRGSSYVVGFGNNPPKQPHHKSSTCKAKPAQCDWGVFSDTNKDNAHVLYGALVGGPDASDNYIDARTDYVMAEVTCDYNAGFQSAVAGLVHFRNN